ncbi:GNAT family N-acetyltransferase [Chitinimonas arctica]|uniref:GNAT family N-acetyltransferase n=1 Tax=Chitinimonas arctica TaxID=2594795 RepID=A0A516SD06_9NEIS|nr:GNAT family N-acetyltransferase [Chitinimonas arctica]QDQ26031.1 GNAT family N-acetyltransferase [Chitinimonas arctica]
MPNHTITVRAAHPDELDWVNQRYSEVDFVASKPGDSIAIAEVDGVPAGIGRVVSVGSRTAELGGMYVFDQYQGLGLSRKIITWLIDRPEFDELYCLPFENLHGLYASMGFALSESAPEEVAAKHRWCNEHYAKRVLLMRCTKLSAQG